MTLLLPTRRFLLADGLDADARTYIRAVEAADGQQLEPETRRAIDRFVRGCKADGNLSAIKASCILAGARTLSGALVPLVGTAPTNFNFVSGDYDRKTGLVGNGSTKYLNSNRNNTSDPQDSKHLAVFVSTETTSGASNFPAYIGLDSRPGWSVIYRNANNGGLEFALNRQSPRQARASAAGFLGASRSSASSVSNRVGGSTTTGSITSESPGNTSILVHTNGPNTNYSNGRIAFYSIGEAVDLALLDARVTTLINAIAAAIP